MDWRKKAENTRTIVYQQSASVSKLFHGYGLAQEGPAAVAGPAQYPLGGHVGSLRELNKGQHRLAGSLRELPVHIVHVSLRLHLAHRALHY